MTLRCSSTVASARVATSPPPSPLGANAAAAGRAYLYGLGAVGQAGVDRALPLLAQEDPTTLQLLGVTGKLLLRVDGAGYVRRQAEW